MQFLTFVKEITLRILATLEAKTAKISNFDIFCFNKVIGQNIQKMLIFSHFCYRDHLRILANRELGVTSEVTSLIPLQIKDRQRMLSKNRANFHKGRSQT